MTKTTRALAFWITLLVGIPALAFAHGDAAPQPVDTKGLEPLGDDIRTSNP